MSHAQTAFPKVKKDRLSKKDKKQIVAKKLRLIGGKKRKKRETEREKEEKE